LYDAHQAVGRQACDAAQEMRSKDMELHKSNKVSNHLLSSLVNFYRILKKAVEKIVMKLLV
jgi:hypothetical protein